MIGESTFPIQGSLPGTGKTYTGAHLILSLQAGKRIGITSSAMRPSVIYCCWQRWKK
ncbi:MAG: hypothetical protein R2806_20435 [Saprospiraceae bacterium]